MKVNAIDDRSVLDEAAILSLNNAHAKETSTLDDTSLTELLDMAFYARGIDRGRDCVLDCARSERLLWKSELPLVQGVSRVVPLHRSHHRREFCVRPGDCQASLRRPFRRGEARWA